MISLGISTSLRGLGSVGFTPPIPKIKSENGATEEVQNGKSGQNLTSSTWVSSLLTPYLLTAWSNQPRQLGKVKSELAENNPMLGDLLTLARRVDELEDEVNIKCAERDRARAQSEILRIHHETEREELIRNQVTLVNTLLITLALNGKRTVEIL